MAQDTDFSAILERLKQRPALDWRGPVSEVRTRFWRMMRDLEADAPQMQDVRALSVDGAQGPLSARLYTPFAAGAPRGPGLVFFHGGGFVTGDLDSHDMICRRLADSARARVLSVAYRLAPEHKFPAAPEDAIAATRWALAKAAELGFATGQIGVGGDSAGGSLTAVVAQTLRQQLSAQVLIYPNTQLVQMTPSQIRLKEGYILTQAAQDFFKDMYLPNREAALDVRASPLLENGLSGLPQALVITAGFDPLQDEGKAYADKMAACGVRVAYRNYPGAVHGFFNMTAVSKLAKTAIADAGAWLMSALAAPKPE
jgi:acetyl esterase